MIIGIDPGITGGVAVLDDGLSIIQELFDLPVLTVGKKKQINPYALATRLAPYRGVAARLELVSAMPGQGVSSMFNFGTSFGLCYGVLAALGCQVIMVTPQVWKRRAGLIGKPKDQSRTVAQRLFPAADLTFKKDIGRADALLIAKFGG